MPWQQNEAIANCDSQAFFALGEFSPSSTKAPTDSATAMFMDQCYWAAGFAEDPQVKEEESSSDESDSGSESGSSGSGGGS